MNTFAELLDEQERTPCLEIIERHFIRQEKRRQPCHWCKTPVMVTSANLVHVGGYDQPQVACDRYLKGEGL